MAGKPDNDTTDAQTPGTEGGRVKGAAGYTVSLTVPQVGAAHKQQAKSRLKEANWGGGSMRVRYGAAVEGHI
eukprot:361320-Chlamydomonas_euryale.AAC.4